jgi:hypothetical protein
MVDYRLLNLEREVMDLLAGVKSLTERYDRLAEKYDHLTALVAEVLSVPDDLLQSLSAHEGPPPGAKRRGHLWLVPPLGIAGAVIAGWQWVRRQFRNPSTVITSSALVACAAAIGIVITLGGTPSTARAPLGAIPSPGRQSSPRPAPSGRFGRAPSRARRLRVGVPAIGPVVSSSAPASVATVAATPEPTSSAAAAEPSPTPAVSATATPAPSTSASPVHRRHPPKPVCIWLLGVLVCT